MTQKRRIPFSTKAKKQQLQAKRAEKQSTGESKIVSHSAPSHNVAFTQTRSLNAQPGSGRNAGRDPNRYNLKFYAETPEDIALQKEESRKPIARENAEKLELGCDAFYDAGLSFPIRPSWDYHLSPEELDRRENKYFREYVDEIQGRYPPQELSYFELNLETWRQLWRVLEMSDILVVVVDARYPSLLFPPSLYHYVTDVLKVPIILILNKIDAVPSSLAVAWIRYFERQFPGLRVMPFTSVPSYNLREPQALTQGKVSKAPRRRGRMRMAAEGAHRLYELCQQICQEEVDLSSWKGKITSELGASTDGDGGDDEDDDEATVDVGLLLEEPANKRTLIGEGASRERYKNGILTVGCVGQPNVGKSSVINALMGKKVVSVSRTPGHTKHFQTIFLTPTVRLCDCPGLVFPSKVPKALQVLVGSFPIAQIRVPLSTVGYLAKHLDLPNYLNLQHPSGEDEDGWSAYDICEAWAVKRGFMTAKGARPDVHRAANHLLRLALDARFPFWIRPPGYDLEKERCERDPLCKEVEYIQALPHAAPAHAELQWETASESEEEETTGETGPALRGSDSEGGQGSDEEEEETPAFSNKFAALMQNDE